MLDAQKHAIREYDRLLERVGRLAQTLGTARELRSIYRALYQFALESTPCNSIAISLVERGMRTAVWACCGHQEIDLSGVPSIKIAGESPHTMALLKNEVIILDDLQIAMANRTLVPIGFDVDPSQPRASLIAPMSVMGRIVGSFEIQSNQPHAFDQGHETAMRMAANLAAVAIENVRLFLREREREDELRQSQKMEAIGRLAGGVAHDFNNLLTAIIGYAQLIAAKLKKDDPLQDDVGEIDKAAKRAASLTGQLLAFSRKQVLQPKVLDLNLVIGDMKKMLSRLIGEDIELTTTCESDLGRVKADPGQIEQVLLNLVVNARDAMPEGGRLEVRTQNVSIDWRGKHGTSGLDPGEYVVLSVSDTGCGMTRETLTHIFEPFFTTKERGKGTGLGLSTVYGIVSQSGGDITVDSEPGKGATFRIFLPRVDSPAFGPRLGESRLKELPVTETILVVEDEHVVRRLVSSVLEMNGYKVLVASSGTEALQMCSSHPGPIHLLITDVVMPQMSGRELAERVAAVRPSLKVLYMSGYTDDSIVKHGLEQTQIVFVQKPFTPDHLMTRIRALLNQQKTYRNDEVERADDNTRRVGDRSLSGHGLSDGDLPDSLGGDDSKLVH